MTLDRSTATSAQINAWREDIRELGVRAERFYNTEYVCDASDYEQHQLWERYHCYLGIAWEQHNMGINRQIGTIATRPVMAGVTWAELTSRKHLVAFVHSPSELTDYKMLREWTEIVFPKLRQRKDAWNFSQIIHDMGARDSVPNYFTRKGVHNLDTVMDGVVTLETLFPEMSLDDRFAFAERKMQEWGERARAYETVMKAGYGK